MRISAAPYWAGIEVMQGDDQNKADVAGALAREWIDDKGVHLLADGAATSAGLAIQQVARDKKRILVMSTPTATAFIGKQCSPYGFQFAADTYALAKGVGGALAKAGGDSWDFITADYEFGASLLNRARLDAGSGMLILPLLQRLSSRAAPDARFPVWIDDRPQHYPSFLGLRVAGAAMHGRALVPHQHIADPPVMIVDEPVVGGDRGQLIDQRPGFLLGYAFEAMRVHRVHEQDGRVGRGMARDRRPALFRILLVGGPFVAAIQPVAAGASLSAVQRRHRRELALTLLREARVSGAHVGEQSTAFLGWYLFGMQDRQQRQLILEGRIGVPVGGPSDAEPVDLAVGLDVGDPGDIFIIGVTILNQRVLARDAEDAAKSGELVRAEILIAEDQDRMIGEGLVDPRDRGRVRLWPG